MNESAKSKHQGTSHAAIRKALLLSRAWNSATTLAGDVLQSVSDGVTQEGDIDVCESQMGRRKTGVKNIVLSQLKSP
jgi:hypothetical protein